MSASSTSPDPQIAQRVRQRVARERRRRFARQVAFFVVVTAAMAFVIVVQRDTRTVREYYGRAREIARLLEQQWQQKAIPPGELVPADPQMRRMLARFRFNTSYAVHAGPQRTVGVYVFAEPVRLFVRPAGRPVVVFDGRHFEARWLDEDELQRQAQALGIDWLIETP